MKPERSRILAIDDEPMNLIILESLLDDHYQVYTAESGAAGLERLRDDPPIDLVLIDVVMPEMDGYEVCRRIKLAPRTQRIPVLFLTGLNTLDSDLRGFSVGAEDFIHKPFSPPIVLARVKLHLELAAYRRAAAAASFSA